MSRTEVYDHRELLINSLMQLERLKHEGFALDAVCEEQWQKIIDLVEEEDGQKLEDCRQKLKELSVSKP